MTDCCTDYISVAKWVSRAKWICPKCGHDVSLMYVLLAEADRWLIVHKGGDTMAKTCKKPVKGGKGK
ncbi:MAG: hypothetical protein Q8P28_04345 [Deltaproteobacteria bacterium]|nr:hypothetical protein [Deltaproteobacteria bacterium]